MGGDPDGLPSPSGRRTARDFSADAAQDTVILSVQDLAAAQQAVDLARHDQEDEHRPGARRAPGTAPVTVLALPAAAYPDPEHLPPATGRERPPGSTPPGTPTAARRASRRGPGPGRGRPVAWPVVVPGPAACGARAAPAALGHGPAHDGAAVGAAPHAPPLARPARWRVLTVLVLAAVLFAAGAISIALTGSPASPPRPRATPPGTGRAPTPAAIRAAVAARTAAAGRIAGQVSADAIVSCDPQMCALLQARGIPAAKLLPLGGRNPAPLGSDLIVSTAAVRSEFGARLGSVYAPVVLASFGTGSAQTAVRVVAADGARRVPAQPQDRRGRAGLSGLPAGAEPPAAFLGPRPPGPGRRPGRFPAADRLRRAGHHARGGRGRFPRPGHRGQRGHAAADRGHRARPAGDPRAPNTIGALASYLQAQLFPYRPAHITVVRLASGRPVLRVEYGAPSPLGLLGKG